MKTKKSRRFADSRPVCVGLYSSCKCESAIYYPVAHFFEQRELHKWSIWISSSNKPKEGFCELGQLPMLWGTTYLKKPRTVKVKPVARAWSVLQGLRIINVLGGEFYYSWLLSQPWCRRSIREFKQIWTATVINKMIFISTFQWNLTLWTYHRTLNVIFLSPLEIRLKSHSWCVVVKPNRNSLSTF